MNSTIWLGDVSGVSLLAISKDPAMGLYLQLARGIISCKLPNWGAQSLSLEILRKVGDGEV